MMRIHVAILAAGQSLRYGSEDKLSEQVGGKSLLTILLEKIQRISAPWKGCTVLVVSRELAKLCTDGPEICVWSMGIQRGGFPTRYSWHWTWFRTVPTGCQGMQSVSVCVINLF